MGAYIGENNKARKIKGAYIGVDGVARKIKKAYIGVNGIAREVGFASDTVILTIATSTNNSELVVYDTYTSLHITYETPEGVWGTLETEENGKYIIPVGDYEFPIGTTIRIESEYMDSKIYQYLYLNGTKVEESDNYFSYEHTLTTNTVITETQRSYQYTQIDITEIPEGYALVNITASGMGIGSGNTGVTIEGTTYNDTNTLVVPIGTVITCSADNDDNNSLNFGIITVNGENVAVAGYDFTTVTYNYTVTGNVTILLNYNKGDGKVTITEQ